MSTTARKQAPSHEALLADLFELNFRIEDLIAKHELTPAQFLAFSEDETVRKTLDAFESLQTRHQRILARQHQAGAVGYLHQCIMDAPSTIETRRAATALARLTTQMQSPRTPRAGASRPADKPSESSQHTPTSATARHHTPDPHASEPSTLLLEPKPPHRKPDPEATRANAAEPARPPARAPDSAAPAVLTPRLARSRNPD
jgi:hypothetical protein